MHTLTRAVRAALVLAAAMIVPVVIGTAPAYAASWQIVASPSTSAGQLWTVGGSYATGSTNSQTLTARYS